MSRKPNVPCAGTCGTLLWSGGTGSLPQGERMCRPCRAASSQPPAPDAACATCGAAFSSSRRSNNERTKTCSKSCGQRLRQRRLRTPGQLFGTEREKARGRAKTHLRKAIGRLTDITPEYEQALRSKARRCPLCDVKLTKDPYLPASKELDHIVPLNAGGTHTVGNVRIICRTCNRARPNDGSDYTGPVTLWAEEPGFIQSAPSVGRRTPRCEHGVAAYRRCYDCRPRPVPRVAQPRASGCQACGITLPSMAGRGRPRKFCVECAAAGAAQRAHRLRVAPMPARTPKPESRPAPTTPAPTRQACVDCGDPVVATTQRCAECWTEINDNHAA